MSKPEESQDGEIKEKTNPLDRLKRGIIKSEEEAKKIGKTAYGYGKQLSEVLKSKDPVIVKRDDIAVLLKKIDNNEKFLEEFAKLTREGYRLSFKEDLHFLTKSHISFLYFQNQKFYK